MLKWVVLALTVIGLGVAAIMPRVVRSRVLDQQDAKRGQPRKVLTAEVKQGALKAEVSLPGNILAMQSATLYARTSGFLRKLHADIGDHVKAGQLLAEIDAVEVTEQLRLAQARLEEADKNAQLAAAQADRLESLAREGAVSVQQAEQARAQANSAAAAQKSNRAEVSRQGTFTGYSRVIAPFDGVITKRNVDVGALVTAGSNAGITGIFELQQLDALKVFIDVPQSFAPGVAPGIAVSVSPSDAPSIEVAGTVARTSAALDTNTRTLRVEVHLPAGKGLLAGAFARVKLSIPRLEAPLLIPASALVVRTEGTQVVLVDGDKARYRAITVGRDLGREIEVLKGLAAKDKVVVSPADDITEGETFRFQ